MSVLIIGAIGTSIVSSVLLAGVDASRSSLTVQESMQVQQLTQTCAQEAVHRLREDITYADNEPYTHILGNGQCTITSITESSGVYTINVQAEVNTITRSVQVRIDSLDPFSVGQWADVAQ